ncbi:hypothetical protein [Halobacillus seohaensis]|uniref:hypothetical protein n=1 Tax=Halobacillus seohaensis TaxID=447421 RepID=UPI0036F28DB8
MALFLFEGSPFVDKPEYLVSLSNVVMENDLHHPFDLAACEMVFSNIYLSKTTMIQILSSKTSHTARLKDLDKPNA